MSLSPSLNKPKLIENLEQSAHIVDASVVSSDTSRRRRDGLFAARPTIYIMILLSAFVAPYLYKLRTGSIFSCQASGYTSDRYLSYCEATNYGDYEHGAFWFDLEPAAEMSAAAADVLFLGNSLTQFAFSTAATARWFSSASASYYLLGFIAFENSIFAQALLHNLNPRAEVYIINIDDFFQPSETQVGKIVMRDEAAHSRYKVKGLLQFVHKAICMKLSAVCGHHLVIFRSRQNGTWYMPEISKFRGAERPVSDDRQINQHEVDDAIGIGQIFLSKLHAKAECVILTAVPTVRTKTGVANAIASGLGKTLIVPEHLDGLQTFDGTHLDPASAERWSEAFLKTAGPQIRKCLEVPASR